MTRDSIQQEINSIWYIGILRSWVIKVTIILTVEKRWKRIFVLLIFICGNDMVTTVTRSKISYAFFFFLSLLTPFGQPILCTYLS